MTAPPNGAPRRTGRFVLELASDPRLVEAAVEYLTDRARAFDFAGSRLNLNFRVGVAEALTNAILYGNRADPAKRVRVEVSMTREEVALVVYDEGEGFDPEAVPDPTLPENLERSGGRGIFLIRELMDEVRYHGCGNCLRLVLRREREARGRPAP